MPGCFQLLPFCSLNQNTDPKVAGLNPSLLWVSLLRPIGPIRLSEQIYISQETIWKHSIHVTLRIYTIKKNSLLDVHFCNITASWIRIIKYFEFTPLINGIDTDILKIQFQEAVILQKWKSESESYQSLCLFIQDLFLS